ncbi:HD-GYP domain-containing protein [Paenibacillus thermotolerans]|uniref:HD-GYP domain-containing protein n=1 Tax=Paenibacillus thermotolerans TaxID=3027807 RepID=UPI002368C452|nr:MULTISPECIES: HD-GYP domain-containing protein [unclassified Paenibacillus]
MATVAVSMLKSGERIIEDVHTPLGGLLFEKNRVLSPRDLEILRAFMVRHVILENKPVEVETGQETTAAVETNNDILAFYKEYEGMYKVLKRVFALATTGGTLPILDMRNQLEKLLAQVPFYNLLTFSPRRTSVQDYLIHNSILVALSSYQLARWCQFPQKDLIPIAMAGLLHDIGNTRIDDTILYKPNRLTQAEYEELKKHTIIGYNLLKNVAGINEGVKLCSLQHHEREDGSGYPLGVKGDKVHVYAKTIAVTDMFHAMTTHRQYKKASSPYLVLEELMKEAFGKLDPGIVQTFIQKVTEFHNGTVVRLNNNAIGEIVFTDRHNPTRPMVNVNGKIINLAQERTYFIQEVISN